MSFNVNWNNLETESLREYTTEILTNALNSDKLPSILADPIEIKNLQFGKVAPIFEILEIGELDRDRFRGIFKINYEGDFQLVLHTKVQANPLNLYYNNGKSEIVNENDLFSSFVMPNFGLSIEKFNLPLDLKLSDIKILGIGIIVFSKTKGLTLVFRNDPLDNITVSSTFDTVQVLATFLQNQIECQIRDLFRETLPTLIHQLSLRYLNLDGINGMNGINGMTPSSSTTTNGGSRDPSVSNEKNRNLNDIHNIDDDPFDDDDYIMNAGLPFNAARQVSENYFNLDSYSNKNLLKICKLYKSRETLNLNIPNFDNFIQRSNLEKFNNQPILLNYLYRNLDLDLVKSKEYNIKNNEIPLQLITNNDFNKTQEILLNIQNIQSFNYKNGFKNNEVLKPKRRRIKIKKRNSKLIERSNISSPSNSTTLMDSSSVNLLNSTIMEPSNSKKFADTSLPTNLNMGIDPSPLEPSILFTPKPIKESTFIPIKPDSLHIDSHLHLDSPSLLSGVGLGNSYFQFNQKSPIRGEKSSPFDDNSSKSLNYIKIDKINQELKKYNQTRGRSLHDHKWNHFNNHSVLDSISPPPPPPPYYYNI